MLYMKRVSYRDNNWRLNGYLFDPAFYDNSRGQGYLFSMPPSKLEDKIQKPVEQLLLPGLFDKKLTQTEFNLS